MDEPADPNTKLVLIIDDDDGQLDLLKYLVGKEGFRMAEAKSGVEALRKTKELSPDLILLDLMLPGMGGYEILRELQAAGNGDIPVLIASARAMDEKMIATLTSESNVRGFFPKPPKAVVFREKIHTLLNTRPPAPTKSKDAYDGWG